jgi:hypothetical protein
MKGALGMNPLSLKRLRGGDLGEGASSLGTLEDMLREAPDRASLSMEAHFQPKTWNKEGAHIPWTLNDEWRAPLPGTPKDMSS